MQVKSPDLIKVLMKDQKISGRQLSEAVGWNSHTYLQRILRGEIRTVTLDKAEKIAVVLGVPRDVLFTSRTSANHAQSGQEERKLSA